MKRERKQKIGEDEGRIVDGKKIRRIDSRDKFDMTGWKLR